MRLGRNVRRLHPFSQRQSTAPATGRRSRVVWRIAPSRRPRPCSTRVVRSASRAITNTVPILERGSRRNLHTRRRPGRFRQPKKQREGPLTGQTTEASLNVRDLRNHSTVKPNPLRKFTMAANRSFRFWLLLDLHRGRQDRLLSQGVELDLFRIDVATRWCEPAMGNLVVSSRPATPRGGRCA
jgi:hypothetical protein